MEGGVCNLGDDFEIRYAVVRPDTILVVDLLSSSEWTTNVFFDNNSVKWFLVSVWLLNNIVSTFI